MKDYHRKINWLRVLLATVTAIALSVIYLLLSRQSLGESFLELLKNVIPDLVAVLIAVPIIYFLFTLKGLSPQQELVDNIVNKLSGTSLGNGIWITDEFSKGSLETDLKEAEEVFFIGLYLTRSIDDNWSLFKDLLPSGIKLTFIFLDYQDKVAIKNLRDRYEDPLPAKDVEGIVETKINRIRQLKNFLPDDNNNNISIKLTRCPLPFGGVLINPKSKKTKIYVKMYGYKIEPLDFQKMVFEPKHGKIFDDYLHQFNEIVKDARVIPL